MGMDPEKKELWATALESGEYEQGKNRLCAGGKHCGLGVLAVEAVKAGLQIDVEKKWDDFFDTSVVMFGGMSSFLADEITAWAGLEDDNPMLDHPVHGHRSVMELNDTFGVPFPELAKLIREQL